MTSTPIPTQKDIEAAFDYLEKECYHDKTDQAILQIRNQTLYSGPQVEKRHNIWSCTKSFTSTALGLLIEEGRCSLDTQIGEIDSLFKPLYPDVTLRHLATMTSGYNAAGKSRWGEDSRDWSPTPYVPDRPLFAPGEAFVYWDEAMFIMGRILTRIAGESLKSYLDRKLFDKMDFGPWEWWSEGEIDDIPICVGGTGISISASQLLKFGRLFLQRGCWNGAQLIGEDWIREATRVQVPVSIPVGDTDRKKMDGSGGYGYNWWINGKSSGAVHALPHCPDDTAYASGLMNNVCFVIPFWDLVFVRMGEDGNPEKGKAFVYDEFFRRLMGPKKRISD